MKKWGKKSEKCSCCLLCWGGGDKTINPSHLSPDVRKKYEKANQTPPFLNENIAKRRVGEGNMCTGMPGVLLNEMSQFVLWLGGVPLSPPFHRQVHLLCENLF